MGHDICLDIIKRVYKQSCARAQSASVYLRVLIHIAIISSKPIAHSHYACIDHDVGI